ncbi:MAG: hypothetical protein ACTTH8_00345 [Treponema sp.]
MKKNIGLYSISILGMILAACNLQPPSSIQIKASPRFEASLGSRTDDLAQLVQDKLHKSLEGKDIKAYRYQPEGATDTRYLIYYPIKEVDLDVDKMLGQDIAPSFNKKFPKKEFTIPEIQKTIQKDIDLAEFDKQIVQKAQLNLTHTIDSAIVTAIQTALTAPDTSSVTQTIPDFEITFSDFKTIAFGNDSFLYLEAIGNTHITCTLEEAKLNANGEDITGTKQPDGKIKFDVSNKTITNTPTLTCTVSVTAISNDATLTIKANVADNSTIKKVTGMVMDMELNHIHGLNPQTIQVPDNEHFISGKIKTGSITVDAPTPASWKGITLQKSFKIEQTGGIAINTGTSDTYTNLAEPISLNNQNISKESITITPKVKVYMDNATYVHTDKLNLGVTFKIEEFSEVTLKQPEELANIAPITHNAASIKEMIQQITFKNGNPKIEVTLDHNLPGTVGLKLDSTAFNIHDMQNFPRGNNTETFTSSSTPLVLTLDNTFTNFDVKPTITLPEAGTSGAIKTFKLKDIKPGSTLKFSGDVKVTAEWEKVKLNNINKELQTGNAIDLQAFSKYLKTAAYELDILECPMHFYFSSAALQNESIDPKIKISAEVTPASGTAATKTIYADATDAPAVVALKSEQLNFGTKDIITKIPEASFSIQKGVPNVGKTFAELINEKPKSIKLKCNLSMSGTEIDKDTIDNLKGNSKLQIAVLIDAPLGFAIKNDITNKPIKDVLNSLLEDSAKANVNEQFEKDIFRRESGSSKSNEFLSFISTAAINLSVKNPLDKPLEMQFDLHNSSGQSVLGTPKKLTLKKGHSSQAIGFTQEEIKKITETVPCKPHISLNLPKGDYKIGKDAKCTVSMNVNSKLDIDYKIK